MLHLKIVKEIVTFSDVEIEKYIFRHYKNPISLEEVATDGVLISNKISSGGKNYK